MENEVNTTGETAIQIHNLRKSFDRGRSYVIDGINLSFLRGKLTYILGPSGTGKSVLIKHILGLLQPNEGSIWVNGQNLAQLKRSQLRDYRLQFGMLFQNSALFDDLSVFDNVAFPLREHTDMTETEIRDVVHDTLFNLGMKDGYEKRPNELSGGMKKRVGLARAIIRQPSILLYDEPTTGLDPVTRETVDELIAQMKQELKLTSIVISHDLPSALNLGDQIIFLNQGGAVFQGKPEAFFECRDPVVQKFLEAERKSAQTLNR